MGVSECEGVEGVESEGEGVVGVGSESTRDGGCGECEVWRMWRVRVKVWGCG